MPGQVQHGRFAGKPLPEPSISGDGEGVTITTRPVRVFTARALSSTTEGVSGCDGAVSIGEAVNRVMAGIEVEP